MLKAAPLAAATIWASSQHDPFVNDPWFPPWPMVALMMENSGALYTPRGISVGSTARGKFDSPIK